MRAAILILVTVMAAHAVESLNWQNGFGGFWSEAGNWDQNRVPSGFDGLGFPAGFASTTSNNLINASATGITISAAGYVLAGNTLTLADHLDFTASGTSTASLPLTLSGTVRMDISNAGGVLVLSGVQGGSGGITKLGSGTLRLEAANTYGGATTIGAGTVVLAAASGLGGASSGTTVAAGATLRVLAGITPIGEPMAFTGSSTIDSLEAVDSTFSGAIALTGAVRFAIGSTAADVVTLSGVVSGAGGITKRGPGILLLTQAGTCTGTTTIQQGELRLQSGLPQSAIAIEQGTLGGAGTVKGITATTGGAKVVHPGVGTTIGTLTSNGDATLSSSTTYQVVVGSGGASKLAVTGAVALGGATLSVQLLAKPAPSQSFTIVENDGSDAVAGTFNGLAQGATFIANNNTFTISYTGGDGNDVVITASGTPAGLSATASIFAGLPASVSCGATRNVVVRVASTEPTGIAPTGTVTLTDGAGISANGTLAPVTGLPGVSQATITLSNVPVGTYALTATYAGDATYANTSVSGGTFTVVASATTLTLSSSRNPASVGQNVTVTATVTAAGGGIAGGDVTFNVGSDPPQVVALSGGAASITVTRPANETVTITASYAPSSTCYLASSTGAPLIQRFSDAVDSGDSKDDQRTGFCGRGGVFAAMLALGLLAVARLRRDDAA